SAASANSTAHGDINRASISRPRRLDPADQALQLVGGAADIAGQLVNDIDDLLRLADLHQFFDEILVGLQRAQQLREAGAGAAELLGGALGVVAQPAPLLDEEAPLLRLEAGVLLELPELVAGPRQRLVAEHGEAAIVGDRVEQSAHRAAEILDLLSR